MNRTAKQVIYGGLYLGIALLFVWGIYGATVQPEPTCTDQIQNRDEVEIDCGGRYCQSCEIKRLRPIETRGVALVETADPKYSSVLFEVRNPNPAYGTARFDYRIGVFERGQSAPLYEEFGFVPVYASEVKSRALVNIPVPFANDLVVVATTTKVYTWESVTTLIRPKILTREVKDSYAGKQGVVTGILRNDNSFGLKRATITVFAYDASQKLRALSKTLVQDLTPLEERSFKATIILPIEGAQIPGLTFKIYVEAERF